MFLWFKKISDIWGSWLNLIRYATNKAALIVDDSCGVFSFDPPCACELASFLCVYIHVLFACMVHRLLGWF